METKHNDEIRRHIRFEVERTCPKCSRTFLYKGPLASHLRLGHGLSKEEARGYIN